MYARNCLTYKGVQIYYELLGYMHFISNIPDTHYTSKCAQEWQLTKIYHESYLHLDKLLKNLFLSLGHIKKKNVGRLNCVPEATVKFSAASLITLRSLYKACISRSY